jgi:hypothetical protein
MTISVVVDMEETKRLIARMVEKHLGYVVKIDQVHPKFEGQYDAQELVGFSVDIPENSEALPQSY